MASVETRIYVDAYCRRLGFALDVLLLHIAKSQEDAGDVRFACISGLCSPVRPGS